MILIILIGMGILTGCLKNEEVRVSINGFYNTPESMDDENTIVLDGLVTGEFVEIVIDGEIKNFKHIKVIYDGDKNEFIRKEVINSFDTLKDKTIVIRTYMPDGIPSEVICWQDETGKENEYFIREYNLSDE